MDVNIKSGKIFDIKKIRLKLKKIKHFFNNVLFKGIYNSRYSVKKGNKISFSETVKKGLF